eukprot:scaffold13970_cov101-Isochrysis_galbana.AAC.2
MEDRTGHDWFLCPCSSHSWRQRTSASPAPSSSVKTRTVSSYEFVANSRTREVCAPRHASSGDISTCEIGRAGSLTERWPTQPPVRTSHALSIPRLSPLTNTVSLAAATELTMQSLRSAWAGLSPFLRSNCSRPPAEVAAQQPSGDCSATDSTKARPTSKTATLSARATSHSRTVWSKEPEKSWDESGDQQRSDTLCEWSRRQASSSPRLQRRTVWSNEPDASTRPLGEYRTA